MENIPISADTSEDKEISTTNIETTDHDISIQIESANKKKIADEEFDFLKAFANMYVPFLLKKSSKVPYDELVKCLESLSFRIVTTRQEYEKRRASYGSIADAWCPLSHRIVEVRLSRLLTRHSTFCKECGMIKRLQTKASDKAKRNADKLESSNRQIETAPTDRQIEPAPTDRQIEPAPTDRQIEPAPIDEFNFIEAFKNCFVPDFLGDNLTQAPYEDFVKCLLSLSYKIVTTKAEYESRERRSIMRAWCPMRHNIVEVRLSTLLREQRIHCQECGDIKRTQTNLIKYGCKSVLQNTEIREKQKQTIILQDSYTKARETCLERYGHKWAQQSEEVKAKIRATCKERFGVEFAIQNPEVFKRQQEATFQHHEYTLPSGKIIQYQGYEYFCLNELFEKEGIKEEDIITPHYQYEKLPEVYYWDDETDTKRRYYPDFYIPSLNKIIEVKSRYTYEDDRFFRINNLKAQRCKSLGYNFEFRIYNVKGNLERLIVV